MTLPGAASIDPSPTPVTVSQECSTSAAASVPESTPVWSATRRRWSARPRSQRGCSSRLSLALAAVPPCGPVQDSEGSHSSAQPSPESLRPNVLIPPPGRIEAGVCSVCSVSCEKNTLHARKAVHRWVGGDSEAQKKCCVAFYIISLKNTLHPKIRVISRDYRH